MCKETEDELKKGNSIAKQVVEHLCNMGGAESYEVEVESNGIPLICKCSVVKKNTNKEFKKYHWVEYVDSDNDFHHKVALDNPIDGEIIAEFKNADDAKLFIHCKEGRMHGN